MSNPEQWKSVVGFEGLYEVSDQGRVRSLPRPVGARAGKTRIAGGNVLKPRPLNHGHLQVFLYPGHSAKTVHSLVTEAFIGERPTGLVVRHLDGDPANNNLSNLCYGTQSENIRDCYLSYDGRVGPGALTRDEVQQIRGLLKQGLPQTEIAKKFGVTKSAISKIKSGRTFSYLPNNF